MAPTCPQLYLYSANDPLAPAADVEEHMRQQVGLRGRTQGERLKGALCRIHKSSSSVLWSVMTVKQLPITPSSLLYLFVGGLKNLPSLPSFPPFAPLQAAQGVQVSSHKWPESGHVEHYRSHPHEYSFHISQFLAGGGHRHTEMTLHFRTVSLHYLTNLIAALSQRSGGEDLTDLLFSVSVL